jgi:hypothetical protein
MNDVKFLPPDKRALIVNLEKKVTSLSLLQNSLITGNFRRLR